MLRTLLHRPGPIALDIGQDGIRMLQLEAVGKAMSAVAAARWEWPTGASTDPAVRRQMMIDAVREMLSAGHFHGRRVASCLPFADLALRQVRLPPMSDEELAKAVQWEANERFGFPVSPELLHHVVAGEVHQGGEGRCEVLLMATTEDVVEARVALLDAMGLRPTCIDAEPACLFRTQERFLRRDGDAGVVTVLAEVGQSGPRVLISRGRQVKLLKWIDIGGARLNQAVADHLHLSLEDARQLRVRLMRQGWEGPEVAATAVGGRDVYEAVHDAVRPVLEELGKEVNLCLRYCAVTFRGGRADSLMLLGGQAYDPCLREQLAEATNLPCTCGRPLQGVDLSRVDLGTDARGPMSEWAVAAGLALRDLFDKNSRREVRHELNRLPA
jgi:type IV pilus assembly protein PilM